MRRLRRILVVVVLVAGSTMTTGCNLFDLFNGSEDAFDTIGRGYDIFSEYARPSEVKDSRILDLETLSGDDLVERRVIDEGVTEVISGDSVDSYLDQMSGSVTVGGGYKGFTGSISASFSTETYQEYGRSFATVRSVVQKEKIFIDASYTANAEDLKPYLDARFREQINDPDIPPAEIFQAYGTHAITSIFTGGRVEYNATARSSEIVTSRDFGAVAQAGFDVKFLSVDVDAAFSSSDERSSYESHAETSVKVYPAGQSSIDIATAQDYEEWQEAVKASEDNLLAAFDDNGLVGIWNFADDQSRRDELIAGFEEWGRTAEEDLGLGIFEDDTFTVRFEAYGGWNDAGGDSDMDIDDPVFEDPDRVPVRASVSVQFVSENTLRIIAGFDIREDGGDGTAFDGTQTFERRYSGPGTLVGLRGTTSCSNLSDEATPGDGRTGTFPSNQCSIGTINWRADQDGSDAAYVGIGGSLNVPVVVRSE